MGGASEDVGKAIQFWVWLDWCGRGQSTCGWDHAGVVMVRLMWMGHECHGWADGRDHADVVGVVVYVGGGTDAMNRWGQCRSGWIRSLATTGPTTPDSTVFLPTMPGPLHQALSVSLMRTDAMSITDTILSKAAGLARTPTVSCSVPSTTFPRAGGQSGPAAAFTCDNAS